MATSSSATSLADSINDNKPMTEHMLKEWTNAAPFFAAYHVLGETQITPVDAEKYKFDFEGLLHNVLSIERKYTYIYTLVNGYKCSSDYDGNKLRIKTLNQEYLVLYERLFRAGEPSS